MTSTTASLPRREAVARLALRIIELRPGHPTRVAIDGVTASGKSTVAREIAAAVTALGRPSIQVTMDGFITLAPGVTAKDANPRSAITTTPTTSTRSRESSLTPLGPGGDRRYRTRVIDLQTDTVTSDPQRIAPSGAVVIIDGTFLQRPDIRDRWDERVWIDTPIDLARERGIKRDAELLGGPEPAAQLFRDRYHAACLVYIDEIDPINTATAVFGNHDRDTARLILRPTGSAAASRSALQTSS